MYTHIFWVCVNLLFCSVISEASIVSQQGSVKSTDLAQESDDRLLLFSTLDGNLHALEQQTGKRRWKINDRPVVQVPVNTTDAIVPLFLPDPRDGSLYLLGNNREPLKKLPFTIPQLVASSPCRSTDGILYTGKKKDTWFILDPITGRKQHVLSWDNVDSTCPIHNPDAVYVGRTLYSILMVDSRNANRKWNVSFYDYAASPMSKEMVQQYNLVHFTSSSTGRLITMDRRRGDLFWERDLESPVVAAYILDPNGLISLPFTGLANNTLAHLATHLLTHQSQPFVTQPSHMKLYPTLYIGEHLYGLYALPSLVDQNLVKITASEVGPLLLEGPGSSESPRAYPEYKIPGHNYNLPEGFYNVDPLLFQDIPNNMNFTIVFIGHYNIPEYSSTKLLIAGSTSGHLKLLTDASRDNARMKTETEEEKPSLQSIGVQTEFEENETNSSEEYKEFNEFLIALKFTYENVKEWVNQQDNKGLKLMLIILVGCVIAMFWYLQMQVREFQQWSQNGSRSSQASSQEKSGSITATAEELPDGLVRVGKIVFDPEDLLGKGCEGTFVYRGEFDKRKVAVKRLLPECFNFADREVALLRESDAHPNVVRYFCTEQDRMFRYIALELCQATLHDYIQGKCDRNAIASLEILRQATCGLGHLHSLDIVHRDIKPQNVLLSVPDAKGTVRAMISDFGLCKKLQVGRVSFSRRSGITGTDGWIAPEMLNNNERTTYAVDLFSLGCLYYYVLSEGSHPFGDALRRQANILSGDSNLEDLKGEQWLIAIQKPLISALISSEPSLRPSCNTVLSHPIFWSGTTILAFLQDVSDRVEKAEMEDLVLRKLEENGVPVVKKDWRLYIDDEVASDLRKYRSYNGESVRDLLRALRNKKHHYRELSPEARHILGDIPDKFISYWTSRFPLLLLHTWHAMQCVAHEKSFIHYYPSGYKYSLDDALDNLTQFEQWELSYENQLMKESPKKYDRRKDSRIRTPSRDIRKKRHDNHFTNENVGLYRNLKHGTSDDSPRHDYRREHGLVNRNFLKSKRPNKVPDEPLVWSVDLK